MRGSGRLHGRRQPEPFLLPREASFHRPGEDAGEFRAQLFRQTLVTLGLWNRYVNRDQTDTAPDCVIGSLNDGLVIDSQEQFERRGELEMFAVEEPSSDP